MDAVIVKIAKDYTPTPGPRYEFEGLFSGEVFRKTIFCDIVKQAIKNNSSLVVDLDGVIGYGTSFLEEIFGGLIREDGVDYNQLMKVLKIISNEEPYLIDDINKYLKEAWQRSKK